MKTKRIAEETTQKPQRSPRSSAQSRPSESLPARTKFEQSDELPFTD